MKRPLVFTNGCFDVLHRGHLDFLRQASDMGRPFVIGLDSDDCVRSLKGIHRPVNTWEDRREMLLAYPFVDEVMKFENQQERLQLIEDLRPEIYAKGEDQKKWLSEERKLLSKWGGRIVFISHRYARSTTNLLRRLSASG